MRYVAVQLPLIDHGDRWWVAEEPQAGKPVRAVAGPYHTKEEAETAAANYKAAP